MMCLHDKQESACGNWTLDHISSTSFDKVTVVLGQLTVLMQAGGALSLSKVAAVHNPLGSSCPPLFCKDSLTCSGDCCLQFLMYLRRILSKSDGLSKIWPAQPLFCCGVCSSFRLLPLESEGAAFTFGETFGTRELRLFLFGKKLSLSFVTTCKLMKWFLLCFVLL